MMSSMDTTSLLHAWLGHNMSGHCHLEIEILHVLVAQIVVHGRREETKFRQPRKMGHAIYHTILYGVHLAPSCESIVGAIIQF
jgi:hypothetical protein